MAGEGRIVYFDGYCNVCNRFIDFLIRRDRRRVLRFAPLQGRTAERQIPSELRESLATMILQFDGELSTESRAAILSVAALGGVYGLVRVFLVVPSFIRDAVYRAIAKRRYRLFGKRETCRIPTAEERAQFLE